MRSIILLTLALLTGCSATDNATMSEKKFIEIVEDISRAWNEGDAGRATQYFADDAVYEEPPGKQLFKGKRGIFEFFGGENGFDIPMRMAWHNLAFNEEKQVGFGEYTFVMNKQYHGIVVMKFENQKIIRWREYQVASSLEWDEFVNESKFKTFP